jgi:hypothetical protein
MRLQKAFERLVPALRQYRHNFGSEEFVAGYDYEETGRIVEELLTEIETLRAQLEAVKKPLTLAEIDTPNGWVSSSARAAFKNGCLNAHHAILARLES